MGRALPGYTIALVDPVTGEAGEDGEISIELGPPPVGLMRGYSDDPGMTGDVMRGGFYHTGDVASRDEDGYITYVGRSDDVFKASDYRISPFELESVLIEHLAAYKRIRRIEFAELPKTISGKIRRVELRDRTGRGEHAYDESDFT